jgi:hypothetical protein
VADSRKQVSPYLQIFGRIPVGIALDVDTAEGGQAEELLCSLHVSERQIFPEPKSYGLQVGERKATERSKRFDREQMWINVNATDFADEMGGSFKCFL